MRKAIIGLMAALAVVLGLAAPASAEPVHATVLVGLAWDAPLFQGNQMQLQDVTTCTALPNLARSAVVAVGTVRFYSDSACTSLQATVTGANSAFSASGFYRWSLL